MPFYDSKYLVIDGKKISKDHILNQKLINSVLAFDANKKAMTYLTEENYDDISSIRIIFEDGSVQNYNVTYKYNDTLNPIKMYGRVAMYQIDDLGIEYNYDKYIVKQDATIVNKLVNYIMNLDYDTDMKNLVDRHSSDKRGYEVFKAYFNDVITSEENAKKFVMNLLGNVDVGGFIGYVNKSSIINCFSNAKAEGNAGIASFVGQTHNKSTLRNNLTLVNQFKGYKFDGRTGEGKFENFSGSYENAGNAGTSTRDRLKSINLDGKIDIASASAVETVDFYTNTLGWDEEIWDFSKVSTGGIPKLKNSDQNDNSSAAATYHIKSADEFIEKITADPYL